MSAQPQTFPLTHLPIGQGLLGLCPLPGKTGDYAAGLAAIHDFAPAAVLSLVEIHEYQRHNAPTLIRDLASLGLEQIHFPVRDFGTPSAALWAPLSTRLHGLLSKGQRIVIHCLGGCGRTGTIALRLMVETGEDPQTALARLRAARPCAVETGAQLRWAVSPR